MDHRIVTFTTDFGSDDHYVGTMKGVVLSINPAAVVVDICHSVDSFDLLEGALTIASAYAYFPEGTVHIVVVDPGVGSARRAIVAETSKHIFVAPDNGVLSLVYDREPGVTVREIVNDRYFLHPVGNTFHGRDIFAPVAAHISRGIALEGMGPEIGDAVRLDVPRPRKIEIASKTGVVLEGAVLKADKFGNLVTNITPENLAETVGIGRTFRVRIGGVEVAQVVPTYAAAQKHSLFAIFGSMGLLEIALNQGSAAERLGTTRGQLVEVIV